MNSSVRTLGWMGGSVVGAFVSSMTFPIPSLYVTTKNITDETYDLEIHNTGTRPCFISNLAGGQGEISGEDFWLVPNQTKTIKINNESGHCLTTVSMHACNFPGLLTSWFGRTVSGFVYK